VNSLFRSMTALFRSIWDLPSAPGAPARVWRDWVLVAVLIPEAILEGLLRPGLPYRALSVVVAAGLVPTLLWRRSRPLLMVLLVSVVLGVVGILTAGRAPVQYTMVYVLILIYALMRWGSGRDAVIGAALIIGRQMLMSLLVVTQFSKVVGAVVVLVLAMATGVLFRYRAGAELRALDRARLLERERLARDLHDTVAHHVSAIAVRAQAGLAAMASQPSAAGEALEVIEAEASRTLAEMRGMVRVLRRDEPAELAPGPSIADLDALASQNHGGPPVSVLVNGDFTAVSPPLVTAIYRLAQESVTNARRHARHATRIEVRVDAETAQVRLRVTDDGAARAAPLAGGPGYGLVGMRERTHLLGGSFEAGPDPGQGWTVTAVLPRAGATA
jgi:signal transduction histidine kinase